MILNFFKKNTLDYIVIDDLYSEEELKLIKAELVQLIPHTLPVEKIDSAKDENNLYKKDCMSLWVDDFFNGNRDASNILKVNRKLFSKDIIAPAKEINAFFGHMERCDTDTTLINYYTTGQKYESHFDLSIFSAITLIKIGSINGGGLIFTDFNEYISFKDNRMIIFPGCVLHKTESINTDINSYRISISQFLNYREPK
jgi:hypothetical protein